MAPRIALSDLAGRLGNHSSELFLVCGVK